MAQDKGMVKGDILVDDGVHNLEAFSGRKVLMTAPHNQQYDATGNGMIRADNWHEVYKEIRRLAAE